MADRLLFSKTGRAKYISHLDLMRTFQRAFFRSGIQIRHTEGFNPHPFVSIALPLSVGYSSQCEILEFGLVGGASYEEVPARLTAAMPEGIVIHSCYPAQRPVKELSRVNYIINMEYEEGRPLEAETALSRLLGQESLVVRKKSKKAKAGFTEVDLIPLIHSWNLEVQRDTMTLDAVLAAQNPGLNPELIRATFARLTQISSRISSPSTAARCWTGRERSSADRRVKPGLRNLQKGLSTEGETGIMTKTPFGSTTEFLEGIYLG